MELVFTLTVYTDWSCRYNLMMSVYKIWHSDAVRLTSLPAGLWMLAEGASLIVLSIFYK